MTRFKSLLKTHLMSQFFKDDVYYSKEVKGKKYKLNYVRSGTSNVAPDLVVGTSGMTLEGV